MRHFFSFWWKCARIAARGSAPFANDWQWVFGNPTIAAIPPTIIAGIAANFGWLNVDADHPVLGPFAIAAGAFWVTWWVALAGRILKVAPDLYYAEQKRAADLVHRLSPKISIKYDETIPPCKATTIFGDRVRGTCFRVEVENIGSTDIDYCEGYLVEVRNVNQPQELGSMNLTWAVTDQPKAIRLVTGVPQYLDVVNVMADGRVRVATEKRSWPFDRQGMFKTPGDYVFTVVVSGVGSVATPKYSIVLTLTDDWKAASMHVPK